MSDYTVGRTCNLWSLEKGLSMMEICHNDSRRLIAGFVFIKNGTYDYRNVSGHQEREWEPGLFRSFRLAIEEHLAAG